LSANCKSLKLQNVSRAETSRYGPRTESPPYRDVSSVSTTKPTWNLGISTKKYTKIGSRARVAAETKKKAKDI
jgi:hypothetical protein